VPTTPEFENAGISGVCSRSQQSFVGVGRSAGYALVMRSLCENYLMSRENLHICAKFFYRASRAALLNNTYLASHWKNGMLDINMEPALLPPQKYGNSLICYFSRHVRNFSQGISPENFARMTTTFFINAPEAINSTGALLPQQNQEGPKCANLAVRTLWLVS
jgi:hypothetical protein